MIKHSGATEAEILISKQDTMLEVQIIDNGKGLTREAIEASSGIGWKNIFSRLGAMNARIDILTPGGKGSRMVISFAG